MASKGKTRWKGHCYMCAMMKGKVKNTCFHERTKISEQRRLGAKRRFGRHQIPEDQK